jgi:citrate synthase
MEGMAKNLQDIITAEEGVEASCLRIVNGFKATRQAIPV